MSVLTKRDSKATNTSAANNARRTNTDIHVSHGFDVEVTNGPVGLNKPQQMGTTLWLPMLAMALMGFVAALVFAGVRAGLIADANPADAADIETLRHIVTGAMFIGFTGVFASISFAVARILGVFRTGGSAMQADVGDEVQTLKMPKSGRLFIVMMAMGMMTVAAASIGHIIVGLSVPSLAEADLLTSERWFLFGEGMRRIGVALYLVGITLGLATIIKVIRFQAIRVRQLV